MIKTKKVYIVGHPNTKKILALCFTKYDAEIIQRALRKLFKK